MNAFKNVTCTSLQLSNKRGRERESVKLLPDYSIGLGAKTTEIEACMAISCSVSYLNYTMKEG